MSRKFCQNLIFTFESYRYNVLPPTRTVIPSSAAAVLEEWTIPLRGVCSAVAPSAAEIVPLCGVTAAARPLCRAHAQDHISILIDAEGSSRHNSTHTTVVLLPMLPDFRNNIACRMLPGVSPLSF